MVASPRPDLATSLRGLLAGDLDALADIQHADHTALRAAADALGDPLIVSRAAAVLVLRGLFDGSVSPSAAQAWASFVRRGYVAYRAPGPIRPLNVEFEEAWEDGISATVSRLDEIGDIVDGDAEPGEVLDLLQLLGQP